jgi:transcription initiation factor TFIID subunit 7
MESKTNNPNSNNSFDIENLFILRMPASNDGSLKPATVKLRQMIESGTALDQHLFINLDLDTRNGSIKLDDELFKGRLVDLPCIIESLKTNDKKTLYKTGDICQMFVCNDNHVAEESEQNTNTADKYTWMHGITPPLKNARKKRFRKVAKKKIVDYVEIEKEVKSLFRADRDAIKVEYEVLYVDEPRETQTDDELLFNDDVDKKKLFNKNTNNINNTTGSSNKKPVYESLLLATGDDSSMNIMNNMESTSSPYGTQADSSNDAQLVSVAGKNTTKSSEYNFFMEEVIGDLSSSSDESDNNDSDSKDETKLKGNKNRSFEVMDIGDESTNLYAPNIDANTNSVTFSNLNYDEDDSSMMMNLFADDNSNTGHQHHRRQLPNDIDDKVSTQQHQHMSLSAESTNQSGASSPATTSTSSLHSLQDTFNKNELNKKLEQLLDDHEQVQVQRKRQEEEINQINNPVLKSRLLPRLNELIDEESRKLGEIENLRHTLSLL